MKKKTTIMFGVLLALSLSIFAGANLLKGDVSEQSIDATSLESQSAYLMQADCGMTTDSSVCNRFGGCQWVGQDTVSGTCQER